MEEGDRYLVDFFIYLQILFHIDFCVCIVSEVITSGGGGGGAQNRKSL